MNLPNKKFDIIYADPPWSYRDSKCGDVIPPEYTSRHIIKNNQIIKVNYTIGKELSE